MAERTVRPHGNRFKDEIGNTYGRLTVLSCAGPGPDGKPAWHCRCECGGEIVTQGNRLRRGITRSCGCLRSESARHAAPCKDIVGRTFGRLTVIVYAGTSKRGGATWLCRCSCSAEIVARGSDLRCENVRSCGCLKTDLLRAKMTVHGESHRGMTPEFRAWGNMIDRCENPNNVGFQHYGGRGISVCECWRHDYPAFLAHIGRRPSPGHSVDRINNDGNYEPGNVRWATRSEQRRNQRRHVP